MALKQWSQLHTLHIQFFDMNMDSLWSTPQGDTILAQSTYAATRAASSYSAGTVGIER